jgi:AraC-like DNA-binding protein
MHTETLGQRRRLYLLARAVIVRYYRRPLTLPAVATALSTSPRQLQRAYAQFSHTSFHEDLHKRRMAVAAQLLIEQRALPVRDVARLVGYRQAPHFARMFRRCYGLSPAHFRAQAIRHAAQPRRESVPGGTPHHRASPQAGSMGARRDGRLGSPPGPHTVE